MLFLISIHGLSFCSTMLPTWQSMGNLCFYSNINAAMVCAALSFELHSPLITARLLVLIAFIWCLLSFAIHMNTALFATRCFSSAYWYASSWLTHCYLMHYYLMPHMPLLPREIALNFEVTFVILLLNIDSSMLRVGLQWVFDVIVQCVLLPWKLHFDYDQHPALFCILHLMLPRKLFSGHLRFQLPLARCIKILRHFDWSDDILLLRHNKFMHK